jgi:phage shock protein PspC (stress-responsive transcriptional regulator)
MIGGVCAGLGVYFNTDPVWFRMGFVLLTLAGGAGIRIYLVLWVIIPEAGPGDSTAAQSASITVHGPMMVGVALIAVGLMLLANILLPWFDRVMWPMAVIAAGVGMLYLGSRHEHQ